MKPEQYTPPPEPPTRPWMPQPLYEPHWYSCVKWLGDQDWMLVWSMPRPVLAAVLVMEMT